MAITAADVKKLRDATGAGMMDAKKALTEADGDFDKAIEVLRVSGQAKAAKRSDREASNGLVAAAGTTLIQLASETDFVAKNDEFVALANEIVAAVDAAKVNGKEAAGQVKLASGQTVDEAVQALAITIGEKLELADAVHFEGDSHVYLHRRAADLPPQVGVIVEYTGDEAVAHGVALHIAAMSPVYVTRDEVPAETVENERRIAEATAREEGKPEGALPKIVEGRVNGFFKDVVLLDQEATVTDDKKTIGKYLDENGVSVSRFRRLSAGA
ncbi:translation elongation factor Ts [Aestuariimicrobium soli]|uniref:translation elongation factor Ts n=1 Tax=Aestuariimicrobium soli TaxID=2035834 RepID=UPI003EB925AF